MDSPALAVLLIPPPMVEPSLLVVLYRPPPMVEALPLATLLSPPTTVELSNQGRRPAGRVPGHLQRIGHAAPDRAGAVAAGDTGGVIVLPPLEPVVKMKARVL